MKLFLLMFLTLPTFAGLPEDIDFIRRVIPGGSDIARLQAATLNGATKRRPAKRLPATF